MNEGQGTERLLEDRQVGLPWHPTQTFYHALKRPPHDSDSEHAVVRRAGAMRRIHEGAVIPDTPSVARPNLAAQATSSGSRKYDSGRPRTPVEWSKLHSRVLPVRGVPHRTYERGGSCIRRDSRHSVAAKTHYAAIGRA